MKLIIIKHVWQNGHCTKRKLIAWQLINAKKRKQNNIDFEVKFMERKTGSVFHLLFPII